jgi:hypothetical protein
MPISLDGSLGITTPMYNGSITANAVTPVIGMKNKIINGNMAISQRGTSFTNVSLFQYTLDRQKVLISYSGGTTNVAQQSDAPDADSKYSIRYTHATANTSSISNYCNRQSIETSNVNDLAGLSATVSFWYKSSRTGNHAVVVSPVGTTGGSATTSTFTVTSANTWEYKTVTSTAFVGVTAWGTDNAEGGYVDVGFNCGGTGQSAVSSGDYFAISRLQLEVGSTATSFDYRPYGTELALCQRYYQLAGSFIGAGGGSTQVNVVVSFGTPMRSAPSTSANGALIITDGYTADYTQSSANGGIIATTTLGGFVGIANFTGLTSTRVYFARYSNNNSIAFSAEL